MRICFSYHFLLSFILILSGGVEVLGQTISGTVFDAETKKQIQGVRVICEQENNAVTTNQNGFFIYTSKSKFPLEFVFFQYGYDVLRVNIEIQKDTLISVYLKPVGYELDPVEVTGAEDQNFSITRLNPVEGTAIYAGKKNEVVVLDKMDVNKATNNSRQVYAKIAGLNIWESDGAGLQLGIGGRGLSPNRTSNFNTRQNGYDISADALGYPESYYTPATEFLDRIEVVRGASSLQYGTQFGGVVNFVMKQGTKLKPFEITFRQSLGSFALVNSSITVGGTKKRFNYFAGFQYKQGEGWRNNAGFNQKNGFVSLSFKVREHILLNADYTHMSYLAQQPGGLTDAMFRQDPKQSIRNRNWFNVNWNLFSFSANINLSSKSQLNIRNFGLLADRKSVGFLGSITRIDPGGNRDLIIGQFHNIGSETRFLHRYALGKNIGVFLSGIRVYAGQTINQQGQSDSLSNANFSFNHADDLEGSDYTFPSRNMALFSENIFYISQNFTITPGVRLEYINTKSKGYYKQIATDLAGNIIFEQNINSQTERERWVFLSGIGLAYKTKNAGEVYGNISQNYRAINFSDLQISNPNYKVDPSISDEYGYTTDAGWRGNWKRKLTYDVSVFYINYKNRIGEVLESDPQTLQVYRYRTNVGNSYNMGVESFVETDLLKWWNDSLKNSWTIFVNYSFIDSRYLKSSNAAVSGKYVELVPRQTLRTGTSFKSKFISATLQYSYTAEQYSDATNATYSPNAVSGIVPAYWVWDFSMSLNYKRWRLESGVNNMMNQMYFTRRATAYPGPGILPADGRNFYVALQVKI